VAFEEKIGVKAWSTPVSTVHRHRENFNVCQQFMQNLLIKTYIGLFKTL
jgi:hypothetical protein